MSTFDADAFLQTIRSARESDDERPTRRAASYLFDVGDFLHSIAVARQIEALEATRRTLFDVPMVVDGD